MRTAFDAVNPANIPAHAQVVMGYLNGRESEWPAIAWTQFPSAQLVHITVTAHNLDGSICNIGDMLDVETGDALPTDAPPWVYARREAGHTWPTVYCNASTWETCRLAFADANVPEPLWFIADWGPAPGRGTPHLLPGTVGTQYDDDLAPGYDVSMLADNWPPLPVPAPTPVIVAPGYPVFPADPGGPMQKYLVPITTDPEGNGAVLMSGKPSVPGLAASEVCVTWASFVAVAHMGSDPLVDRGYWDGKVHAQQRDADVLITVTGCKPDSLTTVVLTATA